MSVQKYVLVPKEKYQRIVADTEHTTKQTPDLTVTSSQILKNSTSSEVERLAKQLAANVNDSEEDVQSKRIKHNELFERYLETLKQRGRNFRPNTSNPKVSTRRDVLEFINKDNVQQIERVARPKGRRKKKQPTKAPQKTKTIKHKPRKRRASDDEFFEAEDPDSYADKYGDELSARSPISLRSSRSVKPVQQQWLGSEQ
jgi:hypothetical protein